MTRSDPSHRLSKYLFTIQLKQKLHLEIFDPAKCPTCLCGEQIDPFGKHIFCCRRVSKKVAHDRIRDEIAPVLQQVLLSGGYISRGSKMEIEPKGVVPDLPSLRPFDLAFRPAPSLKHTHLPTCPYTQVGFDVTITPPRGLHPSQRGVASRNQLATATKHLTEKERSKLARDGQADDHTTTLLTGDEIIGDLLRSGRVLIPLAISPYGRWGPMFHHFLFGRMYTTGHTFRRATRPNATAMYTRATTYPAPSNIVTTATTLWRQTKPKHQHFYGHSYTAPTPREWVLRLTKTGTRHHSLPCPSLARHSAWLLS